jgi:tRNA dimethylallyltransferase
VPHHLIDVRDPDEEFTVAEFQALADRLIREIAGRGRLPMLVGGTGLYVRAVLQDYTFTEMEANPALRQRLAQEEERYGPGHLHRRLQEVDPESAARLHPNDLRRIIRALEVYEQTGIRISSTQRAAQAERRYDDLLFGLTMEREQLYSRIDRRVEEMIAAGLKEEVAGLLRRYGPHVQPLEAIGYREMIWHLRGLTTFSETVALIQRNTRRFAKRQLTWFRREANLIWCDLSHRRPEEVVEDLVRAAAGKWPEFVETKGR